MHTARFLRSLALCLLATLPVAAQQPNTLKHSIPAPPGPPTFQAAGFGSSVAVDGSYAVIGAPYDSGGGVVKVFDSTNGILLLVIPNPYPAVGDLFGGSVAISGTRIVVGGSGDDTGASGAGSAYVFDLSSGTPKVPVAELNNPNAATGDAFGSSVAISGTRVVVGANLDDAGTTDTGSAYVYDLASGTPALPVAVLNNPSPDANDNFGTSVAISGTRVVVGATSDDTGASNAGRAYVYDLAGATPALPAATLNNPGPAVGDFFGFSVAIAGPRVVIAARDDDTGATNAGSVYVYDLTSGTPTVPVATLNNPSPAAEDKFGYSVAISGTRVMVGVPNDDTGASDSGTAYGYDLANATPTVPVATLGNPTPASGDSFGFSVAVSGTRVVVGTPYDDTGASNAGSAYVYDLTSAPPMEPVATLNDPSPLTPMDARFGHAVAVSGTRVVVGAGDDTGGSARRAYVYDLASGTPTVPVAVLSDPGPYTSQRFAYSVAISGTLVVVGAHGYVTNGMAYVYDLASATPAIPIVTVTGDRKFGFAVAISGTRVVIGDASFSVRIYDVSSATPAVPIRTLTSPANGDFGASVAISGTRIVVGTPKYTAGAPGSPSYGRAYLYDLVSATPDTPVLTLNNPNPQINDLFGCSVAISGTRIAIGDYGDDTGTTNAGSAYVYNLAGPAPTVPVTLNNPNPGPHAYFGWSVAISGTRVVVGTPYYDDAPTVTYDPGIAYLYDMASATQTVPVATLNKPIPKEGDLLGTSVAIDGLTAVVGAPFDDWPQTLGTNNGAAYVFAPANPDFDGDGLLDMWEYARFGSTAFATALDDTDEDGRSELLELAFDADPTVSDLWAAPVVTSEGGFLTLTINKRAGVTYLVETASNPDDAAFSAATTTTQINNATTLKVRDNFTSATAAERLIRVKVNAAP